MLACCGKGIDLGILDVGDMVPGLPRVAGIDP